jgi:hypothetical protein
VREMALSNRGIRPWRAAPIHPISRVEGRPATGRQLLEGLLYQQGLGPLDWAGEAKPSLS